MLRAIGRPPVPGAKGERGAGYCNACFTGVYPLDVDATQTKTGFEKSLA